LTFQHRPAAFAVTLSTLAPLQQPPRLRSSTASTNSTTPPRPTSPANADKIPSQTATFRAAQLQSHFSSSSIPHSPKNTGITTTMAQTLSNAPSVFTPRKVGAPHTLEHRVYIEKDGVPVSPFHDIPLYANEQQTILNMVVEIPRWTNAKQEVRKPILLK
jgi:inorganic pyrophosphatase